MKKEAAQAKALSQPPQNRAILESPKPKVQGPRPKVTGPALVTRIVGLLLLCLGFANGLQATPVEGWLHDVGYNDLSTALTFTPTNDVLVDSSGMSVGGPLTFYSTNGYFSTNLVAGPYTVTLPLISWRRSFVVVVPDTNGVVNLTNCLVYAKYFVDGAQLQSQIEQLQYVLDHFSGTNINDGTLLTNAFSASAIQWIISLAGSGGGPTNGVTASAATNISTGVFQSLAGTAAYAPTNQFAAANDPRLTFALTNANAFDAAGVSAAAVTAQATTQAATDATQNSSIATNTTQMATVWNAAGISTNVNDALAYIASNHITDITAQRDVVAMQGEFNVLGQWSNVVDAIILSSRFGAQTNLLSFKLRALTQTNVVWTNWGAAFFSNGWLQVTGLPDSRTNTLVVIWKPNSTQQSNAGQGYLAGMTDTNGNGWWYGLKDASSNQEKLGWRTGTSNVWSEVPSVLLTNLLNLDYGFIYNFDTRWRIGQRRLTAFSASNNVVRAWDASSAGESQINFYTPQLGGFAIPYSLTNSVTVLRVGAGINSVSVISDPLTGASVAAVFLLKGSDTNLIRAAFRAADWLDTDTQRNIYVTHSLGLPDPNFTPVSATNSYVWWLQNRPYNLTSQNTYRWSSYSGARTIDWSSQHGLEFLFRDGLISKMTGTVFWDLGVNDNYTALFSGQTSFGYATNLVAVAKTNGYDSVYTLEADISHTNTTVFTWSTNGYQRMQDFNNLLLTNWYLFSGFVRADLLLDQQVMNNTNYSPDGVHFHSTNGPLVWPKIASSWLGKGDYGWARAFPSFSGNVNTAGTNTSGSFNGDGSGLTGIAGNGVTSTNGSVTITTSTNANGSRSFDLSVAGGNGTNTTYMTFGYGLTGTTNGANNFTAKVDTNGLATLFYPLTGNPAGYLKSGDTVSSLTVSNFTVLTSLVTSSNLNVTGNLNVTNSTWLGGNVTAAGSATVTSSVTASNFNGLGAGLTGIPSAGVTGLDASLASKLGTNGSAAGLSNYPAQYLVWVTSTNATTNNLAGWSLGYTNSATGEQRWYPYITNHP